jgi:hypothetical protein
MAEVTELKWKLSMLSGVAKISDNKVQTNLECLPNLILRNSRTPFKDANEFIRSNKETYSLIAKGIVSLGVNDFFREKTNPNAIVCQCQGNIDWATFINNNTNKASDIFTSLFTLDDVEKVDPSVQHLFISTLVGNAWSKATMSMNWDYPRVVSFDKNTIKIKTNKKGLFIGAKGSTIKEIERLLKRRIAIG